MKVAFVGHRKVSEVKEVSKKIFEAVERLIINENADTFYFGSKSYFNELCYDIVTCLKEKYPHIRRVNFRANSEYMPDCYIKCILTNYEETYFPPQVRGAGVAAYIKRNEAMIECCDVLIVYHNEDYAPKTQTRSGTKLALEYARKNNKRIINVFYSGG